MPQAMKIRYGKVAVDKEWKKLETIPAWDLRKVKSKKEVILEAQRDNMRVHFASLMDMYHLAERTRLFFGMGRHHLKGAVENHSVSP